MWLRAFCLMVGFCSVTDFQRGLGLIPYRRKGHLRLNNSYNGQFLGYGKVCSMLSSTPPLPPWIVLLFGAQKECVGENLKYYQLIDAAIVAQNFFNS